MGDGDFAGEVKDTESKTVHGRVPETSFKPEGAGPMEGIDMSDEILTLGEPTPTNNPETPSRCVVRLRTCCWNDGDGLHIKKTLRFLKRKCEGYNILEEDCQMIGADEVISHITNLDECKDGVYEVVTCNEWGAWETPHIIEDYDYKLIPLNEQN